MIFYYIDQLLISFYRLFEVPIAGYLFGTFCLSVFCVIVGRVTYGLLSGWNRRWLNTYNWEMVRMHNLSLKALSFKDKTAYTACNKEANEAFGKFFFSQMAMGMSTLWPVPFVLSWMELRFSEVVFFIPGIDHEFGYLASFIAIFILTNIACSKIKKHIPNFGTVSDVENNAIEKMMTLADLMTGSTDKNTLKS
jgi:hypothetical protein